MLRREKRASETHLTYHKYPSSHNVIIGSILGGSAICGPILYNPLSELVRVLDPGLL